MQLYFNPVTYGAGDATRTKIEVDAFSGFYLCFQPTRPTSVGRIDIAGPEFRAPPTIAPNYLSTEKDILDVEHGGRLLQAIARTRAMKPLILAPLAPDLDALGTEDLVADFRARASTVYHPSVPAAWEPPPAVRRRRMLRVHGVERLRVVVHRCSPR